MKVLLLNKPLTPNEYKDLVMNHDAWFLTAQYCREDIELQYAAMKNRDALVIPSSTEFFDVMEFDTEESIKDTFRVYKDGEIKYLSNAESITIWVDLKMSSVTTSMILKHRNLI